VAEVLLNKGHTQEAIDELHRKLTFDSNFAPAHSLLGRAYANLGRWDKARYWCESALRLDTLQAETYYVLGLIYEHEGKVEAAIDMFKKAIYLDREAPLLHFHLAMLYKKTNQMKNARKACQNTIKVLEKWPVASIVPDSGGATAKHLLEAARRISGELGN
jgi:chemotaxis protein methyltransferase CheR